MTPDRLTARLVYQSDAKRVYVVDASPPVSVRFGEASGVWCCLTCYASCSEAAEHAGACAHVRAARAADAARASAGAAA